MDAFLPLYYWVIPSSWEESYKHFQYYKANDARQVPQAYKTDNGLNLGAWISSQRTAYKKGKLTEERIRRLEATGIVWEPSKNQAYWRELIMRTDV
jgi:hypothetical protein